MAVDRERAAAVALRLLDEDGMDRLTLRRIAAELGVRAPALYWHFDGKRALLDELTNLMLAGLVDGLGRPDRDRPWHRWLDGACHALRAALLAHRDGARVAQGANLMRATTLAALADRITEVLHAAGFGLTNASRASAAVMWLVVGRTVEEQTLPDEADLADLRSPDGTFATRYPTMSLAMAERIEAGDTQDAAFGYCVNLLITGLRVDLSGATPAR